MNNLDNRQCIERRCLRVFSDAVENGFDSLTISELKYAFHGVFLAIVDNVVSTVCFGQLCLFCGRSCANNDRTARFSYLSREQAKAPSDCMSAIPSTRWSA